MVAEWAQRWNIVKNLKKRGDTVYISVTALYIAVYTLHSILFSGLVGSGRLAGIISR